MTANSKRRRRKTQPQPPAFSPLEHARGLAFVFLIVGCLAILTAAAFVDAYVSRPSRPNYIALDLIKRQTRVRISTTTIMTQVVSTPADRARGLSGRASLAANHGMLFLFDKADYYGFWMPDMKFNLDIVFIRDGKIVDLVENLPAPLAGQAPETYFPRAAADRVLEVNAGTVKAGNWKIGEAALITSL